MRDSSIHCCEFISHFHKPGEPFNGSPVSFLMRFRLPFFSVFAALLLFAVAPPLQAQVFSAPPDEASDAVPSNAPAVVPTSPAPITNAAPQTLREVAATVAALAQNANRGDASSLRIFGLRAGTGAAQVRAQITHLAVAGKDEPFAALARVAFQAAQNGEVVSAGRVDFALRRSGGDWSLVQVFPAPDDAARALAGAADEELAKPADAPGNVLSLVAERRGGRWLSLRRYEWSGRVQASETLDATRAQNETQNQTAPETWLRAQMAQLQAEHPNGVGTAHFFLQRDRNAWVGLSSVWQPPLLRNAVAAEDEIAAVRARRVLEGEGFLDAMAHRELGRALAKLGLWNEATDALQKAEVLRPGLTGADLLERYKIQRAQDPQNIARAQVQREGRIGFALDHPGKELLNLRPGLNAQGQIESPLLALRYGLQYAKLADDTNSSRYLDMARQLRAGGAPLADTASDAAWAKLLFSHLEERRRLAALKPRNTLRSGLFALRCRIDDPQAPLILAALENAQHTVYGEFGIPMGSTEVILWGSQRAFQNYTSRFAEAPTSEFVAALTLTKLINTQNGPNAPLVPLVLNEEVNAFADGRDAAGLFGTVAHEYGHVAVRQLAHGRSVPVWFNEGVATLVEGGYDHYQERVQAAHANNALLSMRDLQTWDVDGERAFLAYSQANSMLDYIVALKGPNSVSAILTLRGQDVDFQTALQRVTGLRSDELWSAWAQSLN